MEQTDVIELLDGLYSMIAEAWGWCFGSPKLPEPSVGGGEMVGGRRGERTRGRNAGAAGDSAGNANAQSRREHTAGAAVWLGDRRWKKLRVSAI